LLLPPCCQIIPLKSIKSGHPNAVLWYRDKMFEKNVKKKRRFGGEMSGAEMKAHTAPKKKSYRERGKKINLITASHNKATTKRIQCPSP
jgi:hypothetical protein